VVSPNAGRMQGLALAHTCSLTSSWPRLLPNPMHSPQSAEKRAAECRQIVPKPCTALWQEIVSMICEMQENALTSSRPYFLPDAIKAVSSADPFHPKFQQIAPNTRTALWQEIECKKNYGPENAMLSSWPCLLKEVKQPFPFAAKRTPECNQIAPQLWHSLMASHCVSDLSSTEKQFLVYGHT